MIPFSKSDGAWLFLRVFGIWLVYTGISALYGPLVSLLVFSEYLEALPIPETASVMAPIKVLLFGALLPLGLGSYCLFSGRGLHDLIMAVPADALVPDGDRKYRSAGLSELEQAAFIDWLDKNPDMKERDLIDQIATFRSSQDISMTS